MITIGSKNEQTFLENYLFNKKAIVDNVWLGGKNDSVYSNQRVYRWQDGSNLTFTNWENGYPKDRSVDSCIQMNSDKEVQGKWTNEPCARKNLVVCEKKQTWSLEKIQTLLVQTMQNQVPLGFIYVQLPYEKSPQEIWSGMTWTDISYICKEKVGLTQNKMLLVMPSCKVSQLTKVVILSICKEPQGKEGCSLTEL